MKHCINPQVDCVFKAILGADDNKPLLISFLNGIVKPQSPIVSVDILNPYNDKETISDKLSIVDVKARDDQDRLFQIELQMVAYPHLPARMIYNWSRIYSSQLVSGDKYSAMNPVISIWLLVNNLFKTRQPYHHYFQLADIEHKKILNDHCHIHVLELDKWQKKAELSIEDQWIYFFKEAKNWTELPTKLNTPELRKAMATLRRFSDKEKEYDLYQAREDAIHEENTRQGALEDALRDSTEAKKSLAEAVKKQEEALEEQARLRELLRKSGIDPDVN